MLPTYPKILASSQDSSQLSLTVTSITKVILYIFAYYAVHKGLNPETAKTQVQGLIDLSVNAVPVVMALYHTVQAGWGLIRKLLSYFKSSATVMTDQGPVEVQSVTPVMTVEPTSVGTLQA